METGAKPENIDKFSEVNESNELADVDLFNWPSDSKSKSFKPVSTLSKPVFEPEDDSSVRGEPVDLGEPQWLKDK